MVNVAGNIEAQRSVLDGVSVGPRVHPWRNETKHIGSCAFDWNLGVMMVLFAHEGPEPWTIKIVVEAIEGVRVFP